MRVSNPLAIGRPSRSCRIAMACLGLLASVLSSTASAGVDAWTTTGPRNAWLMVISDTSATGTIRVAGGVRTALSDDLGNTWSVTPAGRANVQPPYMPLPDDWRFLDIEPLAPSAYCQDPGTPGRLYYGDANISRSDDGGRTWQTPKKEAAKPFFNPRYRHMDCVGPVVFALRNDFGDLQRSTDAGLSFESIPRPPTGLPGGLGAYDAVAFDGQRVVSGVTINGETGTSSRLQVSTDLGATWMPNAFTLRPGNRAISIVASAGGRFVALVEAQVPDVYPVRYTYTPWVSDDGGATFVARPQGAFVSAGTMGSAKLRVDVLKRLRLLAVASDAMRVSLDGGETWQKPAGLPPGQRLQDAAWAVAGTTNAARIVVATSDLGVLVSEDGGATFVPRNLGLPGARLGQIESVIFQGERVELAVGSLFVIGYEGEFGQKWEIALRRRGSASNRWVQGEMVGSIAVAPTDPGLLLSSSERRSTDAGATWTEGVVGSLYVHLRTVPGAADSRAHWYHNAILGDGVAALQDVSTGLWHSLPTSAPPTHRFRDARTVVVAGSAPNVVYVSKPTQPVYDPVNPAPWVGRSSDRGASFVTRTTPRPVVNSTVNELWVDPDDADNLLAVLETGNIMYQSDDGAATWAALPAINGAEIVFTLAVDTGVSPARTYAGTDDGVFVRVGNAATWQHVGESLGMRVGRIHIDGPPDRRTLTLATDRGVWELTQDTAAATLPVFRFYNTQTRTHFYTASQAERDHVLATWPHFIPEGIAFHAVKADRDTIGMPVWRFFNTQTGTHFYTSLSAERAHVLATWPHFVEEGVVYRALSATEPGTVKLFRFFNTETGAHFTTTEDDERDYVNARLPMFVDEGPTYSVYPAAPQ